MPESAAPVDTPEPAALRARIAEGMPRALAELAELVSYRSVADPRVEDPEQCLLAAEWVRDAFAAEGIEDIRLVATPDGSDAVIGHLPAPAGAPTVLLYAHYDVQPAEAGGWSSDPFELTEREGRLYGRGAADCKGNIVAHLLALRALRAQSQDGRYPVGLLVVVEGSEEQGGGGLDEHVEQNPDLFRIPEAILIQDSGNARLGQPTLTVSLRGVADLVVRVEALRAELHSGVFGGAAPDALAALVRMLAALRDERGDLVVPGLPAQQRWEGVQLEAEDFRRDGGLLPGTEILGSGTISDQLWARPAVTILGIDAPPVVGSAAAIQPRAAARLNLRVPPGMDPAQARGLLMDRLRELAPWGVSVSFEEGAVGQPFQAGTDGPVYALLARCLSEAFDGTPTVEQGIGGSIPLTTTLASVNPGALIALLGVEEPSSGVHGPDESVHPAEISRIALAEALFLSRLPAVVGAGGAAS